MRKLSRTRVINEPDRKLLLELKDIVTRHVPDAEIILYGSAARGARQPDSDYDVLVLTACQLSSDELRALDGAVYDLELVREAVLSMMVYSRDEWSRPLMQASPYRKNVMREGIVV